MFRRATEQCGIQGLSHELRLSAHLQDRQLILNGFNHFNFCVDLANGRQPLTVLVIRDVGGSQEPAKRCQAEAVNETAHYPSICALHPS